NSSDASSRRSPADNSSRSAGRLSKLSSCPTSAMAESVGLGVASAPGRAGGGRRIPTPKRVFLGPRGFPFSSDMCCFEVFVASEYRQSVGASTKPTFASQLFQSMMPPMRSLRTKITAAFLAPTLIIVLLFGLLTYFASRQGLEDELGRRLISVGQTLSSQLSDVDVEQISRL